MIWIWALITLQQVFGYYEASARIIGGLEAEPLDHPFLVFIHHTDARKQCAGAMIAPGAVLTAGHCIYTQNISHYDLRANVHNISRRASEPRCVFLNVTELIVPTAYTTSEKTNDIAIIKVKPDPDVVTYLEIDSKNQARLGSEFEVMGWGHTQVGGISSQVPNKLNITVIDDKQCLQDFQSEYYNDCTFCATGVKTDSITCRGDSGGPVITKDGKTIVGLVSFGSANCTIKGAAFTRVYLFKDWIKSKISSDSAVYGSDYSPEPKENPTLDPPKSSEPTQQPAQPQRPAQPWQPQPQQPVYHPPYLSAYNPYPYSYPFYGKFTPRHNKY